MFFLFISSKGEPLTCVSSITLHVYAFRCLYLTHRSLYVQFFKIERNFASRSKIVVKFSDPDYSTCETWMAQSYGHDLAGSIGCEIRMLLR